jgi:transposase InsO family protein
MNNPHQNARTTPLGRAQMVRRILVEGRPTAEVAAGFGVSARTARKWLARFLAEGAAGLENRSCRPRVVANRTAEPWVGMAEHLRRAYRLTGAEIGEKLHLARSTVAGWLTRRGLGRLAALDPREPVRRYQRQRAGELLHLDIKKLARFGHVGHRITGNRHGKNKDVGYDLLHVAIDDATRLAYVEVLPDEKRWSTTAFLVRALRWFRTRGVRVERVMTDNGAGYVAKLFRKALRMLDIRHIRTRPYTPKTNGKAERFIQTILRMGIRNPVPIVHEQGRRPAQMARLVQPAATPCRPRPPIAFSGPRRNNLIRNDS